MSCVFIPVNTVVHTAPALIFLKIFFSSVKTPLCVLDT